jgi:hypothetical protein
MEWKKQAGIVGREKLVPTKIFQRVDFLLNKLGFYQECKGSLRNSLPGDLLHELKGGWKEDN